MSAEKINLTRLYYPISKAAAMLDGCDVDDLIHYGGTGQVEICYYLDTFYSQVFLRSSKPVSGTVQGRYSIFTFYDTTAYFKGLYVLSKDTLHAIEFRLKGEYSSVKIWTPSANNEKKHHFEIFDMTGFNQTLDKTRLFITADEINRLQGKNPVEGTSVAFEKPGPTRNENKQAKMIKALIEIQYGKGSSDTARSLLNTERSTGEMLADFDKAGIRPPVSGKTLGEWLRDVELDYVEISTAKTETSKK